MDNGLQTVPALPGFFPWQTSVRLNLFCSSGNVRNDWLDEDEPGQFLTDGQPRVADLADEIRVAGHELDDLVLAQADFSKTRLNLRRGAELLDAHRYARLHAAQRTDLAAGLAFVR